MSDINRIKIIGSMPAYNLTTDPIGYFGNKLLRDVTFIDLFPASYSLNTDILSNTMDLIKGSATKNPITGANTLYKYSSGANATQITYKAYKSAIKNIQNYLKTSWQNLNNSYADEIYRWDEMLVAGNNLINNMEKDTSGIRILGVNDSMFTETMGNSFSEHSGIQELTEHIYQSTSQKLGHNINAIGTLQKLDYESSLKVIGTVSSKNAFLDVFTGKMLGIEYSTPHVWKGSSYGSTLSLFLKLASPSGDPYSVLKYITIPLMHLIAAGAPLTANGVTYGMPLVWDTRAYGITRFKVGAISSITISRGSYETVFNIMKQPLILDVRLTIMPLISDYAVLIDPDDISITANDIKKLTNKVSNTVASFKNLNESITKKDSEKKDSGTIDKIESKISENFNDFFKYLTKTLAPVTKQVSKVFTTGKDLFDSTHEGNYYLTLDALGTQGPNDEIDGIMGLGNNPSKKPFNLINTKPKIPNTYKFFI